MSNDVLIPPSRREVPMSEIKRPRRRPITRVLPMLVQWSTRKDAQDAGEMVTITTQNANVELPKEQPVHRTWEVQHLGWEVPF